MQYPDETPFRLSGGATVWHLDKLYLIGGYTIEYDCELKSFYQQPAASVWIFDPAVGKWAMGAPLPKASLVTNDKTISFRGYSFGGCIQDIDILKTLKILFFSLSNKFVKRRFLLLPYVPSAGQASSHAGFIYYSGGATLAVNNTYKPADPGPLHKYEYVSFTKVMRLDPNTEDWSQVRPFMTQKILISNGC